MRRALRLLLWPGVLILLVLAVLGVNAALFIAASSEVPPGIDAPGEVAP